MICRHDWCFPGKELLDPGICRKCRREGIQWYDFLSGGVTLMRGRTPITDLRLVY